MCITTVPSGVFARCATRTFGWSPDPVQVTVPDALNRGMAFADATEGQTTNAARRATVPRAHSHPLVRWNPLPFKRETLLISTPSLLPGIVSVVTRQWRTTAPAEPYTRRSWSQMMKSMCRSVIHSPSREAMVGGVLRYFDWLPTPLGIAGFARGAPEARQRDRALFLRGVVMGRVPRDRPSM